MRLSMGLALCGLVLPAAACSSVQGACTEQQMSAPAEVLTEPELQAAPEAEANLVFDVTSTRDAPSELEVLVDGSRALHLLLPASSGCGHDPVHSYGYRLPRRDVMVTVVSDEGEPESLRLGVLRRTQWVVVGVSEHFPLSVQVYDEQPIWG